MAKQVTRTVIETVANVMKVNVSEGTTETIEISVAGKYDNKEKLLKRITKLYDDENTKHVAIVDFNHKETLYGMSEDTFIANATVLPPRKIYNTESTEE